MSKQFRIIVKGRVQGVGYRWFARQAAQELGIRGYVKNLPNGDVEVAAEGDNAAIEKFIDYLKQGPSFAHVTDIQIIEKVFKYRFKTFEVTY